MQAEREKGPISQVMPKTVSQSPETNERPLVNSLSSPIPYPRLLEFTRGRIMSCLINT